VHEDITIANVQSHMHARGVGYAAKLAGEEQSFYENDRWADVDVKAFEPGLRVPAGASLEYYCDYQGGEDRTVYQGPRSTDEMCMLIGSYYPADPRTANCQGANGEPFGGEWIGQGEATCADTMSCVLGIDFENPGRDVTEPLADCVLASDAAVSAEASAFLRCLFSSADPINDCAEQMAACEAI